MRQKKAGRNGRTGPVRLAENELFEYAVRYLAQRSCAREQLRTKLKLRAALNPDVDKVLARLEAIGYLDDRKFAENFAANRADNDGFGRMRVLSDLRARRINPAVAEQAVNQVFVDKNEADLINAYIDRRMPAFAAQKKIEDAREMAKAYRRLRRAGFSSGPVLAALRHRAARPEEIEEPLEDEEEGKLT